MFILGFHIWYMTLALLSGEKCGAELQCGCLYVFLWRAARNAGNAVCFSSSVKPVSRLVKIVHLVIGCRTATCVDDQFTSV